MPAAKRQKTVGILVSGGPAPGINGVIRSVTIEAINSGLKVIGIYEGYRWLAQGNTSKVKPLTIDDVSRIQFSGGSILRTSRISPIADATSIKNTVASLKKLGIDYLIPIGGDGSAYVSYKLSELTRDFLTIAHIPKTIDNDIPLPQYASTFGFHTARHYGTDIIQALMEDATTSHRWYFVVSMGRHAGHLALGIGKSSGATITIIAEEFRNKKITFNVLADILEGSIIKRIAMDKPYGVAILSEGVAEAIEKAELERMTSIKYHEYSGLRFDEIPLGEILKNEVEARLRKRGIGTRVIAKDIGYELRCRPPIPFDIEYTQDLGCAAIRYLLMGGLSALISIKRGGKMDPIPFINLLDAHDNKMRVRKVKVDSENYIVARKYMIRLEKKDFEDREWLLKLARAGNTTVEEFKNQFEYLTHLFSFAEGISSSYLLGTSS